MLFIFEIRFQTLIAGCKLINKKIKNKKNFVLLILFFNYISKKSVY